MDEFQPYLDLAGVQTDRPHMHEWITVYRREWGRSFVIRHDDMNPGVNVSGLFWKPLKPTRTEPPSKG